uniref:signal-transducing adaptor protein 1-like n=1 Tax=Centroberyx gerrardi TaxID=166262 RepID=UPI003AAFE44E
MSVPTRVVHKRRTTITALPLYHSGHLLKKRSKEKDFKKYYGELRGCSIFLYTDDTQDTYTEKLDLEMLKSMVLDSPYQRKTPTIFTLSLHTEEVQLKMDNPDTGEEWRGFILTVTKKEMPSEVRLLPGQIMKLEEALDQEKKRNPPQTRPPLPPRPAFLTSASPSASPPSPKDTNECSLSEMPPCFYAVTRQEAECMLEENPEYGSIILRPSTLTNNYALTLRQVSPSGPVKKSYRVTATSSGFVIELDTAVSVPSLNDVVKYFLEKTEHRLQPYVRSQPYDTRIEMPPAPKCITLSSATPKAVPWAQVAPMVQSQTKEDSSSPPRASPPPTKTAESEYVAPDDHKSKQSVDNIEKELREVLRIRRQNIYSGQ